MFTENVEGPSTVTLTIIDRLQPRVLFGFVRIVRYKTWGFNFG